jgi:transcriptional regulator with XRE-family HTH domain
MSSQLFPALLRYWRKRRGQSQLDLALEAGVSARHVSFLESGRAHPSVDMALRLLSVLQVPLRAQNEALRAAGLSARFPEAGLEELDGEIRRAIGQMLDQQEPYPMTVLGGDFRILRTNRAAERLFGAFLADAAPASAGADIFTLFFDPRLMRPFVEGWEEFARSMLGRLQRELLQRGGDEGLRALLDRILAMPGVPSSWRHPDFSRPAPATQCLRLRRAETAVGFLVAVTKFSAPQQVMLEELSVESCFPLDDDTRAVCERLARA